MARFTKRDLMNLAHMTALTMTPADVEAFAAAAARIGDKYSLHNRFLMWIQDADVSEVAGFHAWKDRGRRVRKGGRGLAIFAPVTRKKDDEAGEDAERVMVNVKIAWVFDRNQTEPVSECPECLAGPGEECNGVCASDDRDGPAPITAKPIPLGEVRDLVTALAKNADDTEPADA